MNNQWSDNLRKQMETHQEPSPEGLWGDIEQIMQQEHSIQLLPKQKKILLWNRRVAVVAAVAMIVLVVGYYFMSPDKDQGGVEIAVENTQNRGASETRTNTPDLENNNIEKSHSLLFSEKTDIQKHTRTNPIIIEEISVIDTTEFIIKDENRTKESVVNKNLAESGSQMEEAENKQIDRRIDQTLVAEFQSDLFEVGHQNESGQWAANLYASNLSSGSTSKYNGYGNLSQYQLEPQSEEEEPILRENPYGEILILNKYREIYTDVKHRQPITMGISVNYKLDDKWSLASGLTYTILSSQLRSGSENYYYNSEQTLHNIGIPLNLNYNIWRNKKLSIYLSGGGLAEKNVSGKLVTDYIVNKELESSKEDDLSIDQLQWSVNTSVGIQYNLTRTIGLYVEPGASYYFKNGSDIETIYKEKPLNVSLRFGLNFSLGGK